MKRLATRSAEAVKDHRKSGQYLAVTRHVFGIRDTPAATLKKRTKEKAGMGGQGGVVLRPRMGKYGA